MVQPQVGQRDAHRTGHPGCVGQLAFEPVARAAASDQQIELGATMRSPVVGVAARTRATGPGREITAPP